MAIGAYPERKVPWPNDCIICQLQVYIVLVLSQNWGNTPCLAFRLWTWGIWWPTMSLGYPLFRQTDGIEQSPNSDWWIIIEAIHISSIYYVYIYICYIVCWGLWLWPMWNSQPAVERDGRPGFEHCLHGVVLPNGFYMFYRKIQVFDG